MRRIVVGVDESEGAAEALRWAVAESELDGAEVTAILTWTWLDQHLRGDDTFDPSYGEDDARQALNTIVATSLGNVDPRLAMHVVCDLPAPALLAAAAHADLLVVGARGAGGFTGLLLGSVAERVLHHSPIPVAIIRPESAQPSDPPRIVAAIDGSEAALRSLRWAVDEARRRSAGLDIVNAWEVPAVAYMPYGRLAIDPDRYERASRDILDAAMKSVDTTGLEANPMSLRRVTVMGILEAAAGASLLVIGSRGRGAFERTLFGSVATQVSHHAPCPLVVVPPARTGTE